VVVVLGTCVVGKNIAVVIQARKAQIVAAAAIIAVAISVVGDMRASWHATITRQFQA
jgi:hypothetical protein